MVKATEHICFRRAVTGLRKDNEKQRETLMASLLQALAAGDDSLRNELAAQLERSEAELFEKAVKSLMSNPEDIVDVSYEMSGSDYAKEIIDKLMEECGIGPSTANQQELPENIDPVVVRHKFCLREDYCAFGLTEVSASKDVIEMLAGKFEPMFAGLADVIAQRKLDEKQVPPLAAAIIAPHIAKMVEPTLKTAARRLLAGSSRPFGAFAKEIGHTMENLSAVQLRIGQSDSKHMSGADAAKAMLNHADRVTADRRDVAAVSSFMGAIGI